MEGFLVAEKISQKWSTSLNLESSNNNHSGFQLNLLELKMEDSNNKNTTIWLGSYEVQNISHSSEIYKCIYNI